jgi:hypothetical protein
LFVCHLLLLKSLFFSSYRYSPPADLLALDPQKESNADRADHAGRLSRPVQERRTLNGAAALMVGSKMLFFSTYLTRLLIAVKFLFTFLLSLCLRKLFLHFTIQLT